MSLAGAMAILIGWLMITTKSPRRLRYVVAFIGAWILTAGMATVVQARF